MSEDNKLAVVQSGFIVPVADIDAAVARYEAFNEFVQRILKPGVDFGEIPGTNKPTLLKPGAEKLGAFFGLRPHFIAQETVNDWTGDGHNGEPFFFREYKCQLYRSDEMVGEGIGSCNSWEKKYRYRWINEMELPARIDKSSLEYADGSVVEFKFAVEKAETSGKYGKPAEYWQRFNDAIENGTARSIKRKIKSGKEMDAWEIGGKLYAVPNKNVADQVNTIDKMAQKRALVAAILIATNASDYFTQDMEDFQIDNSTLTNNSNQNTGDFVDGQYTDVAQPKNSKTDTRPYSPELLKKKIATTIKDNDGKTVDDKQREILKTALEDVFLGDDDNEYKRDVIVEYLTGHESINDLSGAQVVALIKWLEPKPNDNWSYTVNQFSSAEMMKIINLVLNGEGEK